MEVIFANDDLDRLEIDARFTANRSQSLIKAYRKKMQIIRAANDERDFYNFRSLNFESLQGKRKGQYSIRLNDQYRLIFEFVSMSKKKVVKIISIEDYH